MNREDFPFFNKSKLIYLDNAASSQTPAIVLDAMDLYYTDYRANIHRGLYSTSERASTVYDEVRKQCADMFGVANDEIIFTSGSTMSSNMLIMMLENYIKWGDSSTFNKNKIISTYYEHNSVALPIIELAKRQNLEIIYIDHEIINQYKTVYDPILGQAKEDISIEPISKNERKIKSYEQWSLIMNKDVKLINMTMASNVSGHIFDIALAIESIEKVCKERGQERPIIISDMTAIAGHKDIDLKFIGLDAAWCSAHKMCGPTGVGLLYIKRDISRMMKPIIYGGGMVHTVEPDMASYRSDIAAFEAGTANIAGVIGLGKSIEYIQSIGLKNIHNHIIDLHMYAYEKMKSIPYLKLYTSKSETNIGIISFEFLKPTNKSDLKKIIHTHDVAHVLADNNVAVRAGHHCAHLYMKYLDVNSLTRMSLYFYNNKDDIDKLIKGLDIVYNKFCQ